MRDHLSASDCYNSSPKPSYSTHISARVSASLAMALAVLGATPLRAQTPPLVTPVLSGDAFGLRWTADSAVRYRIQSTTNLAQPDSWRTEDLVAGSNSVPIRWTAPEVLRAAKFYRVILPEPEITDVEPAIVPAGTPVTVYIKGEGFGSNDVLRLGSTILTNRVVLSSTLIAVTVTPDLSGTYGFQLDSASTGKQSTYSYSWTVVPSPADSAALYEPPELPWAAPIPQAIKQRITHNWVGEMRTAGTHPAKLEFPNLRLHSGELQLSAVDLVLSGRSMDFVMGRIYRSRTGSSTAMGNNWDFSYDISVQRLGGDILIHAEGRDDLLFYHTNGTYFADGFLREGTLTNDVFRLTFADTGFWEFNPFDGSSAAGKINRCEDRNGNAFTFAYDSSGRLQTIVDDLGRTNTLAYDTSSRLHTVTDFSGRIVIYAYYPGGSFGGSPGDLASVTSPPVVNTPNGNNFANGKRTTYTYTTGFADDRLNHNLASIADGKGQTWLQVFYRTNINPGDLDFDAVDYVQRGPYRIKLRRYPQVPSPSNNYATVKAIVNDGVGNVSECFFDARNRCVRELDYTGRANADTATTEALNRPQGKLRSSDPDFYECRWEWNPDFQCTRVVLPSGEVTEVVHMRAFNQNASRSNHTRLQAANVMTVHNYACCGGADTDGDGTSDLTMRSWYFQYDPRFGTEPGSSAMRERINELEARLNGMGLLGRTRYKGWDGTIKGRFAAGPRQTLPLDSVSTHDDDENTAVAKNIRTRLDELETRLAGLGLLGRTKYKGWDGTIRGATGEWKCEDACRQFAVKVIDPRRNTTVAAYDPHGNPTLLAHEGRLLGASDVPVEKFVYNPTGQLVYRTNAADATGYQRVDKLEYYTNGPQAGYCSTFTVDTQGPVVTRVAFEYDNRGNLTRCVDPRGNDIVCTYNALDQCVRSASPTNLTARCVSDYYYDANDNLVRSTVELRDQADNKYGIKSDAWSFDTLNRCDAHIEQVSAQHYRTNGYAYDGNDNLASISTPEAMNGHDPLNVMVYSYDERDLPFRDSRSPGVTNTCVREYSYDANGRKLTVTVRDAFGNAPAAVRSYGYDGFGRCATATDAMGNVCTRAYDVNDNPTYERVDGETNDVAGGAFNQRLSECRMEYDSLDRCTRTHYSFFDISTETPLADGDSTTTRVFAPNGSCVSVTDDNAHTTRYAYDTVGRISVVTDAKNNTITYGYDACGNAASETRNELSDLGGAPQVFVTYNTCDNLDRCIATSDNVGNTNRYAYDSLDRCVAATDRSGVTSGWTYDYAGRVVLAVADLDRDGTLDFTQDTGSQVQWDDNSRCVVSTNANGFPTIYAYDALDRCVAVTNADGTDCKLIWSPRSNLTLYGDENRTTVSNSFDLLGRCIHRDISPGAGVAATTTAETYTYDGCSRPMSAVNDVSQVTYQYDSMGNCLRSGENGLTLSCTYDGVGNRLSMTYPGKRVTTYTYDALDHVATLNTAPASGLPPSNLAEYSYDGPGRLARIFRVNSMASRFFWDGAVSPPNVAGDFGWRQVAGVNHQAPGGGASIDRRAYAYDRGQNKVLRAQLIPWVQGGETKTNTFAYDAVNRLLSSVTGSLSSSSHVDYGLDRRGNRQGVTNNGVVESYTLDAALPEPGDLQMDQYTSTPSGTETHDRNGNLTSRGGPLGSIAYVYDYADRLVEVDGVSTGGYSPIATFAYDALGRCIGKTTYPPSPLAPVTTTYLHDCDDHDPRIIEQRTSGAVSRVYLFGGVSRATGDLDGDGDGDLDVVAFDAGGQAQFYHCDELGNVLALSDATGVVLERYDYDDFGAPTFLTPDGAALVDSDGLPATVSAAGNPLLFHGMYWDDDTGLYRLVHRQEFGPTQPSRPRDVRRTVPGYDPGTGRYVLRAGVPVRFGANAYAFSGNNPWSPGSHASGGGGAGGSIAIDEPGVHLQGIAIDEPGVHYQGIAIDEPGVHFQGIAIDEPGVHFNDVAQATLHLHKEGIVHRDLAARNFLVGRHEPKISDFGMSRMKQGSQREYVRARNFELDIDLVRPPNHSPSAGFAGYNGDDPITHKRAGSGR